MRQQSSSWNKSSRWYTKVVGKEGHYYHQHGVIQSTLKLLHLSPQSKLLDVGCGQGVLSRSIPSTVEYCGIDNSPNLIHQAIQLSKNPSHRFLITDATKPFPVEKNYYSHATILLALQNMADCSAVFKHISQSLQSKGILVIVLNHPCFRIPRQSGWEIDEVNKQQKRWINRYMSPMTIPIVMHPGQSHSETTLTFHQPISAYVKALSQEGFSISDMEELVSDKESVGNSAKMENRSRSEIPLFLAIKAVKA